MGGKPSLLLPGTAGTKSALWQGGKQPLDDAEGGCFDETFVPPDKWEDIWAPDVYVANAIDTDYGAGFLRLRHDVSAARAWAVCYTDFW